ncbi:metallophosphoesterase [Marinoscillum sp. MHG1-6]|uniref:metallophosphoesterase family protein n=1 Tax=Marinoscillum sp. MHG1-6 TaxID=2959627 RepID=UPI002157D33F|nr:metallophosphoesterase family protein [Marinoscillum sp. MHG1-6]
MKIGLISDTHYHLEESVFEYFKNCDEIWHAGDIGGMEVLQKLESFKPTVAVWGNIDDHQVRAATSEGHVFEREGVRVLMTHIAGRPPKYNKQVHQHILRYKPRILVCGHSHILKVQPDKANNLIYINPGAAGIHGFHKVKTIMRFDLKAGKIENMEVIELGLRGQL